MSVLLLRSDQVNKCPRHILDSSHYVPDGCLCISPEGLTIAQKEKLALTLPCPACGAVSGFRCLNQSCTRMIGFLKYPHPERTRLIDPGFAGRKRVDKAARRAGYRRSREITGLGWKVSDSRNKNSAARNS